MGKTTQTNSRVHERFDMLRVGRQVPTGSRLRSLWDWCLSNECIVGLQAVKLWWVSPAEDCSLCTPSTGWLLWLWRPAPILSLKVGANRCTLPAILRLHDCSVGIRLFQLWELLLVWEGWKLLPKERRWLLLSARASLLVWKPGVHLLEEAS